MKSDLTCPIEIVAVEVKQSEAVPEAERPSATPGEASRPEEASPGEATLEAASGEETPAEEGSPEKAASEDGEETESGAPKRQIVCEIEFLCLVDRRVESVQMNIVCFDDSGARLGGRLVRAPLHPLEDDRYAGAFLPEHVDGTVRVEASVEKVWFRDGVVWRREERNVREYTPNALPEGRELDRLRAVAGPDAMGYAREEDVLWMCVCGRANPIGEDKCLKCRRMRAQVVKAYSFAAIDATVGEHERQLEQRTRDSLRRSSEQTAERVSQERKASRARKRRAAAAVALLAAAALALAAWRWGVPLAATRVAKSRLDGGLAADAKSLYDWVEARWPGQFGAKEGALLAQTRILEGLLAAGTDEALAEAAERAREMPRPQADEWTERAVTARAALKREAGDLAAAEALYRSLPESEQAAEALSSLVYEIADAAQERLDYPTAIERFASLGDYEDAAARREDCIERYGRQLLREGQYEKAAEQFLLVSGREGMVSLARQSYYELAQRQEAAGEYDAAAARYESLGVYEEAEARAKACRYAAGMDALGAGDMEEAARQLRLAGDYEDARERFEETATALGDAAMEADDPLTALGWYDQLSRSEASTQARNEATYALAQRYEAQGRREDAALTYASLGDYEDAADRARALEYELATDEMDASPEAALVRFEELGDYKDAQAQAALCRYLVAENAYAAGEYERAVALFEALGDYADSAQQLRRCRYALADARAQEGRYDDAASLFGACGAYLDAEERALRARYDGAAALADAGELAEAARAFRALGSYEDAPARAQAAEDAWLSEPHTGATMDMELGDYASVIEALAPLWRQELPARYADIPEMYARACLLRAQELIGQNRPLDALPLLEQIEDDKQAAGLLDAYVYRIIGTWESRAGALYVFRRDGSCTLDGQDGYFGGHDYDIAFGDAPYPTGRAYSVVNLRGDTLTLRDAQTDAVLRLTYVGEPTALTQEEPEEEATEDAPDETPEEATDAPEAGDAAETPMADGAPEAAGE